MLAYRGSSAGACFKLDYKGTLLESVFKVRPDFLSVGAAEDREDIAKLPVFPKRFILDHSFLVTLWLDGAEWPYLAVWVDSGGILPGSIGN